MDPALVHTLGQRALWTAIEIAAPVLLMGLLVGLVVSLLQAATQIQEFSLSFIPKVAAVALGLAIFGPWMLNRLTYYANTLLVSIPQLLR